MGNEKNLWSSVCKLFQSGNWASCLCENWKTKKDSYYEWFEPWKLYTSNLKAPKQFWFHEKLLTVTLSQIFIGPMSSQLTDVIPSKFCNIWVSVHGYHKNLSSFQSDSWKYSHLHWNSHISGVPRTGILCLTSDNVENMSCCCKRDKTSLGKSQKVIFQKYFSTEFLSVSVHDTYDSWAIACHQRSVTAPLACQIMNLFSTREASTFK